jgi:hypothetical protein
MNKTGEKIIYWTPRILGILFLAFSFLFSLDAFSPGATAGEMLVGFLMHNIPAIALLIVLILSWKKEIIGGVIFTMVGVLYFVMVAMEGIKDGIGLNIISWNLTISLPAILIGILFLAGWMNKKKNL